MWSCEARIISNYFTNAGIKNDKGNVWSLVLVTLTSLSQHCYIHVLYGPLVMEKVFEVFILYMDMAASFGHVTNLICWNICSRNQ